MVGGWWGGRSGACTRTCPGGVAVRDYRCALKALTRKPFASQPVNSSSTRQQSLRTLQARAVRRLDLVRAQPEVGQCEARSRRCPRAAAARDQRCALMAASPPHPKLLMLNRAPFSAPIAAFRGGTNRDAVRATRGWWS